MYKREGRGRKKERERETERNRDRDRQRDVTASQQLKSYYAIKKKHTSASQLIRLFVYRICDMAERGGGDKCE